ncbi:MAG: COX15/CtaA family protein [Halobacteriaceae archaeon]
MARFRSAVTATAALVFLTVLLGVSTKAAGAGLACNARWPLCDGGFLNLFPATVPSAFEWLHRVVAGVTGLAILGTAALAWHDGESRAIRSATTLGLALTPVQVYLGRQTVTVFSDPILAAHYWTAMGIFGSFAVATTLAWRDALTPTHARRALLAAAVLVPVQVAVGPLVVATYTPPVQALHYAITLLLFAAIYVAATVGWETFGPEKYAVAGALALTPVLVSVGRAIFVSPSLVPVYELVAAVMFVALAGAAVATRRAQVKSASPV